MKKREILILKYIEEHPLCTFSQIRRKHGNHEYHTEYLHKILDKLIQDAKIQIFHKRYYCVPKPTREIDFLVNLVKLTPLTKSTFRNFTFQNKSPNPTFNTIINNCICLYILKLKTHNLEKRKRSFIAKFVSILQKYSDDDSYDHYLWDKGFFNKLPLAKKLPNYDSRVKRILLFLLYLWRYSYEYYDHIKNNKTPLKDLMIRLRDQYNEEQNQSSVSNKALKKSLAEITTIKGIYKHSIEYRQESNTPTFADKYPIYRRKPILNPDRKTVKSSRPMILEIAMGILGHKTPSKRKHYAEDWEQLTDIPFTEFIPLQDKSNILRDASKE